ncbi:unnamed protein product [Parnassius apollo]|uniref:(apollo) hypothetical protein n=1 Tax=Parnassius apollo TaxID=110799 RepID=A0A8S3XBZ5_PARAO|nr:unnamed protein product [Parnassius apollo]
MSRRSKIIALALAKSEITDSNAEDERVNNRNNDVENNVPLERRMSPNFIETGNDLLSFKYNLRQRTPVKIQNDQTVSNESEEIYSPVVSEYLPPQENTPSVLTPDADTESVNNEFIENYNNEQIEDILREIVQNQELSDAIEPGIRTSKEQSNVIGNGSQTNAEEPRISSHINVKEKKKYPKKVNPGRKRFLNKENWKAEICKRKKNLGEEFINRKGQLIAKKIMKADCGANCSRKCREAITENQRSLIFKNFWELGDHNKQMDYISRFVRRVPKKQVIAASASSSRRKWSFEYNLFIEGQEIRTCKTMFLNTLSISDMWLQTLFKKIDKSATGTIINDKRGRHGTRKNAVPDQVKQSVRDHISQMPLVDSHYVRNRTCKQYLDEQLNFPILYKLYLEWMNEKHSDQVVATSRQYREIFKTDFNIDFNKPKKDQCPSSLPNIIKFQYDYLSDNEMAINLAQDIKTVSLRAVTRRATKEPQNSEQELPISKAYNAPLPLSTAKYKDLISLCNSNAIPTIYHDYFINLPHVKTILPNNMTDSD